MYYTKVPTDPHWYRCTHVVGVKHTNISTGFLLLKEQQQHWKVIRFSDMARFLFQCWAIGISFTEKTILRPKALVRKTWGTSCDIETFIIKNHNIFVSTLSDTSCCAQHFPSRWCGKDSGLCVHVRVLGTYTLCGWYILILTDKWDMPRNERAHGEKHGRTSVKATETNVGTVLESRYSSHGRITQHHPILS